MGPVQVGCIGQIEARGVTGRQIAGKPKKVAGLYWKSAFVGKKVQGILAISPLPGNLAILG